MRSPVLAAVLLLAFVLGCDERPRDPARTPSLPDAAPGAAQVVTLRRSAQEHAGIRVAPLAVRTYQAEQLAYGAVLSLRGLADFGQRYARAQAEARSAAIRRRVTRDQFLRLKQLEADQNASARARQAAEGAFDVATVDAEASRQSLRALEGAARQQWGAVIARWLFAGSPAYARLVDGREVLLRVTLPVGAGLTSVPRTIRVRSPRGALVGATLVSPAPETDPRIQGMSYFYQAPAQQTELLPGMTVVANLPLGQPRSGVVIPGEAVVWWQGKPWAYEQVAPEQFTRREVPTETPLEGGYFAVSGFSPGALIVIQGAQEILSVQIRPPAPEDAD